VDVIVLLLFIGALLVIGALVFFGWTLKTHTYQHSDRLSLLPLENEGTADHE
jgi:hypothetical protein